MTFIEGIGDEVTAFFVILIVVVLATLVTFIGSGPHAYSPVHARAVHIAVLSSREPTETANAIQSPDPHPPDANNPTQNTNATFAFLTPTWPTANHFYGPSAHEAHAGDVTDDTEEEQSSSDETTTRPAENDAPESEAAPPTAPPEEDTAGVAREEEGGEGIRVRLKYLDDTERTVRSSPLTKVADFKRNHFPEDLANNRVVRLIFCGHLLRDNSTLESYRVVDNSVVHVQVLQAQAQQTRSSLTQQPELDLSHLLWPLISVILGMCWVLYYKYPDFFGVISLSLLFVFTASFFVFYTHIHQ